MKRNVVSASFFPSIFTLALLCAPISTNTIVAQTPASLPASEDAGTSGTVTMTPALKFEKDKVDFGTVEQGNKVTIDFPFKNVSDKTITIENIRASCGCTTPSLEKKVYAPGEGEVIKAIFDSARRSGVQTKTVTVTTDDPAQPSYSLSFTGSILQSLFMEEPVFQISDIDRGTAFEGTTHIINLTGEAIDFSNINPTVAGIQTSLGEPEPYKDIESKRDGFRIPLKIVIPETMPAGSLDGSIEIVTNNDSVPRLSLPMRGQILGDLVANPPKVFFGNVVPKTESKRRVILTAKQSKKFVIQSTEVVVTQGAGKPTVTVVEAEAPVGRPNSQAIDITMISPEEQGHIMGELKITGTLGDAPYTMSLPYNIFIRPDMPKTEVPATTEGTTGSSVSTPARPEDREKQIQKMRDELKQKIEARRKADAEQKAQVLPGS